MSAIEEAMLAELARCAGPQAASPGMGDLLESEGLPIALAVAVFGRWIVLRELPVDQYRLDFAVIGGCVSTWRIAVECDGHNYHERTKEQAAHDRRRDRHLQRHGWHVMRFTGSEIFRDVRGCVAEVLALAADLQGKSERDLSNWRAMYERGRE